MRSFSRCRNAFTAPASSMRSWFRPGRPSPRRTHRYRFQAGPSAVGITGAHADVPLQAVQAVRHDASKRYDHESHTMKVFMPFTENDREGRSTSWRMIESRLPTTVRVPISRPRRRTDAQRVLLGKLPQSLRQPPGLVRRCHSQRRIRNVGQSGKRFQCDLDLSIVEIPARLPAMIEVGNGDPISSRSGISTQAAVFKCQLDDREESA